MTAKYTLGKHKVLSKKTVSTLVVNVVIVHLIHTALCTGGLSGADWPAVNLDAEQS